MVSELVALARPRYHLAAGAPQYYTRLPYVNKDLGAGVRVTRFIGIAPLNNPGDEGGGGPEAPQQPGWWWGWGGGRVPGGVVNGRGRSWVA